MKIDFRSSLKISEQFADWLDVVLEAALEDRFSSTPEALSRLNSNQGKPEKYSLSVLGSDVRLDRNSDRLEVNISLYDCKIDAATQTFSITAIVNFVLLSLLFSEEIVLSKEFVITLHCCVSICIILLLGQDFFSAPLAKTRIIDKQNFYLEHSIFGIKRKYYGITKHIDVI